MTKSNRKRNISTIIILAIVLLVPGFLYVGLNKIGSNEYVKLPVFGDKSLSGKMNRKMGREIPDTIFHTLKEVTVINSEGNEQNIFKSDSTIKVVHLFYGNDQGLSKEMLKNFKPVASRFAHNDKIKFYSISIDTADNYKILRDLEKEYINDSNPNWKILGSNDGFLTYAKENLLIDAFQDPTDNKKFVFGNSYILIDSQNRIRGFYDMNLKTEIDRMQDEIKVQIVEEIRNNPLKIEKK